MMPVCLAKPHDPISNKRLSILEVSGTTAKWVARQLGCRIDRRSFFMCSEDQPIVLATLEAGLCTTIDVPETLWLDVVANVCRQRMAAGTA